MVISGHQWSSVVIRVALTCAQRKRAAIREAIREAIRVAIRGAIRVALTCAQRNWAARSGSPRFNRNSSTTAASEKPIARRQGRVRWGRPLLSRPRVSRLPRCLFTGQGFQEFSCRGSDAVECCILKYLLTPASGLHSLCSTDQTLVPPGPGAETAIHTIFHSCTISSPCYTPHTRHHAPRTVIQRLSSSHVIVTVIHRPSCLPMSHVILGIPLQQQPTCAPKPPPTARTPAPRQYVGWPRPGLYPDADEALSARGEPFSARYGASRLLRGVAYALPRWGCAPC